MTFGINHLGKDITSSHAYQVYDEGVASLTSGSYTGIYEVYAYASSGPLYRYDFSVLPGSGANIGLTFIKPDSAFISAVRRSDGGITLLSDSAVNVNFIRFVNSKIYTKPTTGFGMYVLAADGTTVLLDMSKNNLVIRSIFSQVSGDYSTASESNVLSHGLGYVPYILVNTVNAELSVLGGHWLLPLGFKNTSTNCYVKAGIFSPVSLGGSSATIHVNVKLDYILTDGA